MDQEKIRAYYEEQKRKQEERRKEQLASKNSERIAKAVEISDRRRSLELNQPQKTKLVDKVASPEDIAQVVNALNDIIVSQTVTNDDLAESFKDVAAGMLTLSDEISALPKEYDNSDVVGSISSLIESIKQMPEQEKQNLSEVVSGLKDVSDKISQLKLDPKIDVEAPNVDVQVPEINVQPLVEAINRIQVEVPETVVNVDTTELLSAMVKVGEAINGLEFPIPNYVLPFKDQDGKATQLALNNDRRAPVYLDEMTRFNEIITTGRISQFTYKPTWGISALRYETTTTGTGAAATELDGEFKLSSGTSTSGESKVRTLQRGQYHAGAMGQAGIGIRIPTNPTSTAFMEWGYTDFANGFYFGLDATGPYVAIVDDSNVTKTYQTDWNQDKLDGTGDSGLTLDLSDGVISQIDFTWYGYGDIEFNYYIQDPDTKKIRRVTAHRQKLNNQASIEDPNQPLAFRVGNGASNTTSYDLYIGGHQFSTLDNATVPQLRQGVELITNYTTATNTNWQPLIAIRKKSTFAGKPNSIQTMLSGYEIAADGDVEVRITVDGTTSNLSWGTPTGRTASETSVETKVSGGTALTTSVDGEPYDYGFASGTNQVAESIDKDVKFFLGVDQEMILWVRRLSATGAIVVKHAHLEWTEEW